MMKSKKIREVKDYYCNQRIYDKLWCQTSRDIIDVWKYNHNVLVTEHINKFFEKNRLLAKLIFSPAYEHLIKKNKVEEYNVLGGLTFFDFDHYEIVNFKNDLSKIPSCETIAGVVNFLYLNWNQVKEFIDNTPSNWEVYIINPYHMRYVFGSVGLFLTPKYCNGYYIKLCNNYFLKLSGFPLFLKFSFDEEIEDIVYNKPVLNLRNYAYELIRLSEGNVVLIDLINFWYENDEVHVSYFEDAFLDYMDNMDYDYYNTINFIEIICDSSFKLIHKETGNVLGEYKKFSLDKAFKVIDTEKGEQFISDEELCDLLCGKYEFILNREVEDYES